MGWKIPGFFTNHSPDPFVGRDLELVLTCSWALIFPTVSAIYLASSHHIQLLLPSWPNPLTATLKAPFYAFWCFVQTETVGKGTHVVVGYWIYTWTVAKQNFWGRAVIWLFSVQVLNFMNIVTIFVFENSTFLLVSKQFFQEGKKRHDR